MDKEQFVNEIVDAYMKQIDNTASEEVKSMINTIVNFSAKVFITATKKLKEHPEVLQD